jgi:hypothetical protein
VVTRGRGDPAGQLIFQHAAESLPIDILSGRDSAFVGFDRIAGLSVAPMPTNGSNLISDAHPPERESAQA